MIYFKVATVEEGPRKRDDNQRRRSAKKKTTAADQPSVDEADVSSQAPSRVHIFKGRPLPGVASKSKTEPLQCSSSSANTPAFSGQGAVPAPVLVGIQPVPGFKGERGRLRIGIEKGKKAVWEMAMKVENLEGMKQTLRRTRQTIFKTRR